MLASPEITSGVLNINCCDPLGRSALLMAIDNENLEMVELLLDNKVSNCLHVMLSSLYSSFVVEWGPLNYWARTIRPRWATNPLGPLDTLGWPWSYWYIKLIRPIRFF